jgi:hypothetical protein
MERGRQCLVGRYELNFRRGAGEESIAPVLAEVHYRTHFGAH